LGTTLAQMPTLSNALIELDGDRAGSGTTGRSERIGDIWEIKRRVSIGDWSRADWLSVALADSTADRPQHPRHFAATVAAQQTRFLMHAYRQILNAGAPAAPTDVQTRVAKVKPTAPDHRPTPRTSPLAMMSLASEQAVIGLDNFARFLIHK
jgi:hypothetical protein